MGSLSRTFTRSNTLNLQCTENVTHFTKIVENLSKSIKSYGLTSVFFGQNDRHFWPKWPSFFGQNDHFGAFLALKVPRGTGTRFSQDKCYLFHNENIFSTFWPFRKIEWTDPKLLSKRCHFWPFWGFFTPFEPLGPTRFFQKSEKVTF